MLIYLDGNAGLERKWSSNSMDVYFLGDDTGFICWIIGVTTACPKLMPRLGHDQTRIQDVES